MGNAYTERSEPVCPGVQLYGIHIDGGPGFDGLGALADYLLIEKELRRAAGHLRTYWYSCHR